LNIIKKNIILILSEISEVQKFKIRNKILNLFDKLRINDIFRLFTKKQLIILLFHGITKKNFSFNHRRYFPKSIFEKQINYLKKKKYVFISLTDWADIVKNNKKIKHRYVVLTFDDGFKNIIEYGYPIMKKYGAKGCFYIVSDLVGQDKLIWNDYVEVFLRNYEKPKFKFKFKDQEMNYSLIPKKNLEIAIGDIKAKIRTLNYDERITHFKQFELSNSIHNFQNVPKDYLIANWDEIKSLDKNILDIGCHTKTHTHLANLKSKEEYYRELFESKKKIEKEIGYSINHICYPTGSYNKTTLDYVKKYEYLTGVTIKHGFNSKQLNMDLIAKKQIYYS
jgi:peptidoglycan/xylan/chitin deacetylase (PgdA/CDA1 family)